ncbi:hypothetical protein N7478_004050 [Penicillium angulare]|uniref:uncharacterized protein n=1 Tax=Penicillium angulare TaxID=116970 RepID=UPI002540FAB1|nr:uncharacterized protein N7478_004050 [Penicillium angulare]KAJ5278678.1 hypothetical protein N7478_004050 [Penicillium angulare]
MLSYFQGCFLLPISSKFPSIMPTGSLLNFLSVPREALELYERGTDWKPFTNRRCPESITELVPWPEFSYDHIIQEYGSILDTEFKWEDRYFGTQPQRVYPGKDSLRYTLGMDLEFYVKYAFKETFKQLAPELSERDLVPISLEAAYRAEPIKTYSPDLAFMASPLDGEYLTGASGPNRLPGGLKGSLKWKSDWGSSSAGEMEKRFCLLELARIHLYTERCGTRYGFILTDQELVAIKRDDTSGRIALSKAILLTSGGTELSVSLDLWYLGMLAAKSDWKVEA